MKFKIKRVVKIEYIENKAFRNKSIWKSKNEKKASGNRKMEIKTCRNKKTLFQL